MSAYMIVELDVHDPEGFNDHRARVPALIKKHGGEYIVRGGESEVIEGSWKPKGLVVFRFPDRKAIHAFFDDPDYAELKALRLRTSTGSIVAVDGMN